MSYEDLLIESDQAELCVKEIPLTSADGRIRGKRIAIRQNIPTLTQKACVLAEELGHHYTTYGNIMDQSEESNRKQELKARLWAYNKLIGLSGIVKGYQAGCRNRHELAECLNVTEDFLQEAIDCYKEKYGTGIEVDNYTVIFEPVLAVVEKI